MNNDHLITTVGHRRLECFPPISDAHGGKALVFESSVGSAPRVRLDVTGLAGPSGAAKEVTLSLATDDAWKLAEQLIMAVCRHYRGNARPEESLVGPLMNKKVAHEVVSEVLLACGQDDIGGYPVENVIANIVDDLWSEGALTSDTD